MAKGMTEEQVRNEWNQTGIGRDITQDEIDNWTRFGSPGQLVGELSKDSGTVEGRKRSNAYNKEHKQWDKVVDPLTGNVLSGWRDTETGEISYNPNSSLGENSIPIWGKNAAAIEKAKRAIDLYDTQSADTGFDPDTDAFDASVGHTGDWFAIPDGVDVADDRLTKMTDENGEILKLTDKDGNKRTLYAKVSKKKKFGAFGKKFDHYILDKIPGTMKDLTVEVGDSSSLGIGSQAIGGTELSSRGGNLWSGIFGGSKQDWDTVTTEAVPLAVASVVGAVYGQWWLGPTVASAQAVGKTSTAELQGDDVDWADLTEDLALMWASSYAGVAGGVAGSTAFNAATAAYNDEGLDSVLAGAAYDIAGAYVGRYTGKYGHTYKTALKAFESYQNGSDTSSIISDAAVSLLMDEVVSAGRNSRSNYRNSRARDIPEVPNDVKQPSQTSSVFS